MAVSALHPLFLFCLPLDLIVAWSETVVCRAVLLLLLASGGVRFQYIPGQDKRRFIMSHLESDQPDHMVVMEYDLVAGVLATGGPCGASRLL